MTTLDPTFLRGFSLVLAAFAGAFIVALWVALIIWTYRDIRSRHRDRLVHILAAVLVALLNLPFGYWRAGVDKFSRQWFLAVHLPVPFVVALRVLSGLGFHLATLPIMIGAYFIGQFMGGS